MSMSPELENLRGSTPSQVVDSTSQAVKVLGMVGTCCLGVAALTSLLNVVQRIYKPEREFFVEPGIINIFAMLGILGVFIHAAQDKSLQVRRGYGLLGGVGFALGVLMLLYYMGFEAGRTVAGGLDTEPLSDSTKGRWYGIVGLIAGVVTLFVGAVGSFTCKAGQSLFGFPGRLASAFGSNNKFLSFVGYTFPLILALAVLVFFSHVPLTRSAEKISKYSMENAITFGVLPLGAMCLLLSLPLLFFFSRHEDEEGLRGAPACLLRTTGTLFSIIGLVDVVSVLDLFTATPRFSDYLLPYGLILTLLGFLMLGLSITMEGEESDSSDQVGWWMGAAGLVVFIIAAVGSFLPWLAEALSDRYESLTELGEKSWLIPNGFIYMAVGLLFWLTGRMLVSTKPMLVIARRELASFLTSPIAYLVLAGYAVVSAINFFFWLSIVASRSSRGQGLDEPVLQFYFTILVPFFLWFAIPMLTMRLFSEEQRSGTIELLFTAPLGEVSVVVGKFLGCLFFYMLGWLIWILFPLLLRVVGQEAFDYRPILSFLFVVGVIGANFLAMGTFFSSLTKNQIIAFIMTFAGMMVFLMPYLLSSFFQNQGLMEWFEFIRNLSYWDHLEAASTGRIEIKTIVFHVSLCIFWLFLTIKVLESRKWR